MAEFLGDDFLLESDLAARLYHEVAAPLPIIDFHGHLPPAQMAADHRFRSITEIWLDGDHYKWRAMRANGVAERFCTGDATDWEKFEAWARTVPDTVRNPLYHWTHMELRRPFGIAERLSSATARIVFDRCNELLQGGGFSTLDLLARSRVAVVCTTDDPTDSLEPHRALAARKDPETQVFPTWRPDRALAVDDPVAFRPPASARAPRPRARLGPAVPPRSDAEQQHPDAPPPRTRHRLRLDRGVPPGRLPGPVPRSA